MDYSTMFDDASDAKGFTSFFDWIPDWMFQMKGKFFMVKDGQLYRHYDETVPRNNFFGQQYTTRVKTIFNDIPSEDKIFKTLVLESSHAWDAFIRTNYTEAALTALEFNQRESRWFSPTPKDETATDRKGFSVQGIGEIDSELGTDITFLQLPDAFDVGNDLYQVNGSNEELIGTIVSVNRTTNVITVNAITTTPVAGRFAFAKKSNRIEGGEIRGRYMEVELTNDSTELVEIFAITSNAVKSYV